jgi:hypothetical protein
MTWTAPMTAVAGAVFTAAQYNQHVRDNFLELDVAQATVENSFFAGNGPNDVVQRTPTWAARTGGSTTTSTSYTDLADAVGPSVTVATGTIAMVWIYCNQYNTSGSAAWMTFEISGDTTLAASDTNAVQMQGTDGDRAGAGILIDTLTGGMNTFTAKHRVSTSGTGYFSQRRIVVWPF